MSPLFSVRRPMNDITSWIHLQLKTLKFTPYIQQIHPDSIRELPQHMQDIPVKALFSV
jgi:hypothetical protein